MIMQSKTIASFITFLAFASQAVIAKEADNRAYVQSGPDGVLYARCIPRDAKGSAGSTDIYLVKQDQDELLDHYEWYSKHGVTLGWSPIAGKVAVMARHKDAPTSPDNQVELTFHLGGKLLKTWTTADLEGLGAEVGQLISSVDRGTKRAEFKVLGCEQIPATNQYVFTIQITSGDKLLFDILTGEQYLESSKSENDN